MSQDPLVTQLTYYGTSPWEIEVIYSYFNSLFTITQNEIELEDPEFVSMLDVEIPLAFNEEFFKWFDFKRWENIKALFKEMKRRRGGRNALNIQINFVGSPNIRFVLDSDDRQWYFNAIEKIDVVLELLPYHLDPEKLPNNVTEVVYKFDEDARRWRLKKAHVGEKKFEFGESGWKMVT